MGSLNAGPAETTKFDRLAANLESTEGESSGG